MQFSRFCLWNSFLVTAQQEKQSKSADKKTAPLGRKTVRVALCYLL